MLFFGCKLLQLFLIYLYVLFSLCCFQFDHQREKCRNLSFEARNRRVGQKGVGKNISPPDALFWLCLNFSTPFPFTQRSSQHFATPSILYWIFSYILLYILKSWCHSGLKGHKWNIALLCSSFLQQHLQKTNDGFTLKVNDLKCQVKEELTRNSALEKVQIVCKMHRKYIQYW